MDAIVDTTEKEDVCVGRRRSWEKWKTLCWRLSTYGMCAREITGRFDGIEEVNSMFNLSWVCVVGLRYCRKRS